MERTLPLHDHSLGCAYVDGVARWGSETGTIPGTGAEQVAICRLDGERRSGVGEFPDLNLLEVGE